MECGCVVVDRLNAARHEFARAIAAQKKGLTITAESRARKCLELLVGLETEEETAAGAVVICHGETVCEPEFLHVATATERFRQAGISL